MAEEILQQRKGLPVYNQYTDFRRCFTHPSKPVMVLMGETGSGKTTQIPQFSHEILLKEPHKVFPNLPKKDLHRPFNIVVTQPRRVAAISVAKRVSEEMNVPLGDTVGYQVRFEEKANHLTRIKFVTDGLLVREAIRDPTLSKYHVIIIDEAHERSIDSDLCLGILKKLLSTSRKDDLRVIVMSATLASPEKLIDYYSRASCTFLSVSGRSFPIEINYFAAEEDDMRESTYLAACQLHCELPVGDMLIFLPGQEDIRVIANMLREANARISDARVLRHSKERNKKRRTVDAIINDASQKIHGPCNLGDNIIKDTGMQMLICELYASQPIEKQIEIFKPTPPMCRKIVLATNIAETSITISGLRYVLDSGKEKIKMSNNMGIDTLKEKFISRASAIQRAGRAGREAPGVVYRLYPEDVLQNIMAKNNVPEIQRISPLSIVLSLLSMNMNPSEFPFLDPPQKSLLIEATKQLKLLGAIDRQMKITDNIGKRMTQLPVNPILAKILLESIPLQCTKEALTLIAMQAEETIWFNQTPVSHNSLQKKSEQDSELLKNERRKIQDPLSDHITLIRLYNQWDAARDKKEFCERLSVSNSALLRAKRIRQQLVDIVTKKMGLMSIASCGEKDMTVMRKCLARSMFLFSAVLKNQEKNIYVTTIHNLDTRIHPGSSIFDLRSQHSFVVYGEILQTKTHSHLVTNTVIEKEWLIESGHFVAQS